MSKTTYLKGNVLNPANDKKHKIIVHIVNDVGVMGSGVARNIAEKWPIVVQRYMALFAKPAKERATAQGQIQLVNVGDSLYVCNLFGQSGIGDLHGLPAVRYDAVEEGLLRLKNRILSSKVKDDTSIHMPRIGCGLAGGSWARIEDIIDRVFQDSNIPITVYDFPGSVFNP